MPSASKAIHSALLGALQVCHAWHATVGDFVPITKRMVSTFLTTLEGPARTCYSSVAPH